MREPLGEKLRPASLYGFTMGMAFSTPAMAVKGIWPIFCSSPMAPITVRSSPRLMWAWSPASRITSARCSISSAVASGFITIIMGYTLKIVAPRRDGVAAKLELTLQHLCQRFNKNFILLWETYADAEVVWEVVNSHWSDDDSMS